LSDEVVLQMIQAGHVAHMREMRSEYKILYRKCT